MNGILYLALSNNSIEIESETTKINQKLSFWF